MHHPWAHQAGIYDNSALVATWCSGGGGREAAVIKGKCILIFSKNFLGRFEIQIHFGLEGVQKNANSFSHTACTAKAEAVISTYCLLLKAVKLGHRQQHPNNP